MIGINLFYQMCQLCVRNINDVYISLMMLAGPQLHYETKKNTKRGKGLLRAREEGNLKRGTKGIRSLLRVNLFPFFSSNYKVYISVTYFMQSETKRWK